MTTFDKIKDVLILQHGRIHIHQKGKGGDPSSKGSNPSSWTQHRPGYPSRSKGKGKTGTAGRPRPSTPPTT
eukprot:7209908-Pyramimonas_sp.AAC.1